MLTTTIEIPFAGGDHRVGPVPAGQTNILRAIRFSADPAHLNLTTVWQVPEGTTLERITEVVRTLLLRHESLRTVHRLFPEPVQTVLPSGVLPVAVHEVDRDAVQVAEAVGRELRSREFDLERELPLRLAVVTCGGVPVHVAIVVSHVAADATTWELLMLEWQELAAGRDYPVGNEPQPIDLVAVERRPTVQRLMGASVRYWTTQLRTVPQAVFAEPRLADADPLFAGLRIHSVAAADSLGRIAERTGAGRSSIVLAAMALLVGHRTGHRTCVVTSLSAGRFLPELRQYFGTLAQDALMPVDVGGAGTFDEAVRQVQAASLRAYRASWFDPMALWEGIEAVGHERGTSYARDCVFNDMSGLARRAPKALDQDAGPAAPQQRYPGVRMPQAAPRADLVDEELGAEFSWLPREWMAAPFTLYAHRLTGELELGLWASPQVLSRSESVEFSRGLLRLITEAADRDVDLAGLAALVDVLPVRRGAGWYLVDGCQVETAAVGRLVGAALGGRACLVTAAADPVLGHRLTCHLADPDKELTPQAVHEAVMAALPGAVTAMAPHEYVLCARIPEEPGDPEAWRQVPVLQQGTGRREPAERTGMAG